MLPPRAACGARKIISVFFSRLSSSSAYALFWKRICGKFIDAAPENGSWHLQFLPDLDHLNVIWLAKLRAWSPGIFVTSPISIDYGRLGSRWHFAVLRVLFQYLQLRGTGRLVRSGERILTQLQCNLHQNQDRRAARRGSPAFVIDWSLVLDSIWTVDPLSLEPTFCKRI